MGSNYFQRASLREKDRVREFYGNVLEWELNEIHEGLDIFGAESGTTYGVQYTEDDQAVLTEEQFFKSTWLSLRCEDRTSLIEAIRRLGVTELPDQSDENNFFFHAPGGQVYVV